MQQHDVDPDDLISTTSSVEIDLTRGTPYQELVAEEIEHYSSIQTTDDLTEGGVHAHKSWAFYYDYLEKHLFGRGFADEVAVQAEQFERPRLLSLGCGYGGHELEIARILRRPYQLIGVDLNPHIYSEAQRRAISEGLNVHFKSLDLNFVRIRPGAFDVIYAHASVHHVLNLEHLFSQVCDGLTETGRLVIMDIIGKTQVLFWKENVEFAASLIKRMPRRYRPRVGKRLWKNSAGGDRVCDVALAHSNQACSLRWVHENDLHTPLPGGPLGSRQRGGSEVLRGIDQIGIATG